LNRPNNLRGQIVRDIRRKIPPAESAPTQIWTYQHIWPLLQELWRPDPRHRPSASGTVFLLSRAGRNLPPIAIKRIVLFSATFMEGLSWGSRWQQRTQSLLALSLVSRSFYACAFPFLYQDIRIFPVDTVARLSKLVNTFNISAKGHFYGFITRTFLLCLETDAHILPSNIQRLLDKMTKLHTLVVCTINGLHWPVRIHSLSSVVFSGASLSLTLDQGTLRVLLPFHRLVYQSITLYPQMHGTSHARQVPLLPNLRDIEVEESWAPTSDVSPYLFDAFKNWTIPRLNSLSYTLGRSNLPDSSFTQFLQIQGPLLGHLTIDTPTSAPISDILPLCSNLRSLYVNFFSPFDLCSVPPHLKLQMLYLYQRSWSRGERAQLYLDQFEKFSSSWRIRLPNLRVARLEGRTEMVNKRRRPEMRFCTMDRFYTINDGGSMYKRWQGKWIGAGTLDISVEDSADATSCTRCELSSTLGNLNRPPPGWPRYCGRRRRGRGERLDGI
jgi:hypothetical protein